MDMRRFEVLCKVVELKSFTKAAEALFLSQPTVSEHVRTLEEAVGEKLIDRLGREALPTPAGRIFYQYAHGIFQLREEAFQALQQFRGNLSGNLILGGSTIPGTYVLPAHVGSFKAAHPAIRVTLRIANTAQIAEEVLQGDVEAGIVGSRWNDRRLALEEIYRDELVLAVYPDHPWAQQGRIQVRALAEEPFLSREFGSGTRMAIEKLLEEHGLDTPQLSVAGEVGSTEAMRQGIKARLGIGILSRLAVDEDVRNGSLAIVDIDGVRFHRPLYLITQKNHQMSPLCTAFLQYLRDRIAEAEELNPQNYPL